MNALHARLSLVCLAIALGGCRASARGSASVSAGTEAKDFADEPIEPVETGQAESDFVGSEERALLGARHDLRLAPDVKTATCSCLAVVIGSPTTAGLAWMGEAPRVDPESQLVIALSSEGIDCPGEPEDSLGASYWGYRREGDDVIVIIESAKFGRPITTGAVIPKPFGNGQVYVRPASKAVPYGRPLVAGEKDCRIGNPGPPRSAAPPTSGEGATLE